jgi:clan AA aspartic protease
MGITYVEGRVSSDKGREEELRFLVDSGANYTVLPKPVWKKLKLKPKRVAQFVLADGTTIDRHISECLIHLDLGECHTPVVLGEEGDEPLLGVVTLEEMGLVLNPFNRSLHPMRMLL